MRRRFPGLAAAGLILALAAAGCGGPAGGPSAGGWSGARKVLHVSTVDARSTVTCVRPGTCTAAYAQGTSVLAVSERHGVWGRPQPLPGLYRSVTLSCADADDCIAAGDGGRSTLIPSQLSKPDAALVAVEIHGVWGRARPIPGLADLRGGGQSGIGAVGCSAAGWCSVSGDYWPRGEPQSPDSPSFVASEHDGAWRPAQPLPGLANLKAGRATEISDMSCDRSGQCTVVGSYPIPASHGAGVFVLASDDGVWGPVLPIGGLAALAGARSSQASVGYLACPGPGSCTAAGYYTTASGHQRPFTVTESHGRWGRAESLPGTMNLRQIDPSAALSYTEAIITALSCPRPGQCVIAGLYGSTVDAGGEYGGEYSATVPFVASQVDGRWRAAAQPPGLAALNRHGLAYITALSCGTPGNCAAGGYTTGTGPQFNTQAFLLTQSDGRWAQAGRVPDIGQLGAAGSGIDVMTCTATAGCDAVGYYLVGRGALAANDMFVTVHGP